MKDCCKWISVLLWMSVLGGTMARAAVTLTTVQGTVYRADGNAASGTLIVSWPAFSTAAKQAVAAGSMTAQIGARQKEMENHGYDCR